LRGVMGSLVLLLLLSGSFGPVALAQISESPTGNSPHIQADLAFLTSSLLDGRQAGSEGAAIAAQYVAAGFQSAGLEPFWPSGDFIQKTAVRRAITTGSIVVGFGPRTTTLRIGDHVLASARAGNVSADGELVFVGYGISAPEFGWDDIGPTSLEGKIALVLDGDPGTAGPTAFRADTQTTDGLPEEKLQLLSRLGVTGVMFVHESTRLSLELRVALDPIGSGSVEVPRGVAFVAWTSRADLERLLASGNRSFDVMLQRARQSTFQPITVGAHVVVDLETQFEIRDAAMVAGRIPGTTDATAGEVLLVAHYDELRRDKAVGHNAPALAAVLAVARRMRRDRIHSGRPVVFVATPGGHTAGIRPSIAQSVHSAVGLDYLSGSEHQAIWGDYESSIGELIRPLADSLAVRHANHQVGLTLAPEFLSLAKLGVASLVITGTDAPLTTSDTDSANQSRAVLEAANLTAIALKALALTEDRPVFLPTSTLGGHPENPTRP